MSDKNIDDQTFENQSSDYDETYEDDVAYTDDDSDQWSDDESADDEDSASEQPAPKKKKSSNLLIAIIMVFVVIGVFGFMAMKGNNGTGSQAETDSQGAVAIDADADSSSPVVTQADQAAQGETPSVQQPAQAPVVAEPQQGLMDNPNLAVDNTKTNSGNADSQVTENQPPSTMTAPNMGGSEVTGQTDSPAADTPSQEVVNAISPTVKPVSDFPTVDAIKKPDDAPVPVMTGATATDTSAMSNSDAPAVTPANKQDGKLADLQAKVDAAQDKITTLEKKISDQAAELEAQKQISSQAPATTSVSEEDVDALKEKIADLEEKLAEKSAVNVKPKKNLDEEQVEVVSPSVAKTSVAPKQKPALKQVWSLKSAGIGKAILLDKATGDLKAVRVGDVVSGLGRIVSISSSNSSWVVKGTLGSVSE